MKLTHVRLLVVDLDACFRFYRDVMGFEVLWGREGGGYAVFEVEGGVFLALFPRQEMAEAVGAAEAAVEVECQDRAMLIFGVEDVGATVAGLRARGAEFVGGVEDHPDWGIRTAHLRDPAGTLIELNSPLAQEEWTEDLRIEAQRLDGE